MVLSCFGSCFFVLLRCYDARVRSWMATERWNVGAGFFGILLLLDFDRSSLCLNAIILLKLNLLSRVPPMLPRVRKCARSAWRALLPLGFPIRFR